MIEAIDIKKNFGTLSVLKGVDFSVQKAEIVSIVGASGAGKTTFLQILGTLDRADKGQVIINGEDVGLLKNSKLANFRNQNIGFVFQTHQLLPEFTALENVIFPALIAKTRESKARKRAKELLELLSLTTRINHKPGQMSGGEQQRVAVARALINNPAVILADEPSGSLDSENKQELHDLFFKLRNELQQTFVIVTHDPLLASLTDRTVHMADGYIIDNNINHTDGFK